jgi:hypothetical protein
MKYYDSDFLKLPHIPFIIELPDMCFKVHIPLCTAAQKAYLPFFDLIPKVGYKTLGFLAYCSMFTVIGKDGWGVDFKPEDWSIERESGIDDRRFSLDVIPASGYEAWVIYSLFKDRTEEIYVKQGKNDLDNNRCSPKHVKKFIPDAFEHIRYSTQIKCAVSDHVLSDKVIKKRKREEIEDIDLVESYRFLLSQQAKPNKERARLEAIKMLYPNKTDEELHKKEESLEKIINRLSKAKE